MKILVLPFIVSVMMKFSLGVLLSVSEDCQINHGSIIQAKNILYIMPAIDESHSKMNDNFIRCANLLGFKLGHINISPNCSLDDGYNTALNITEDIAKRYNVVNLKVSIPLNYFIHNTANSSKLSHVGYIHFNKTDVKVCKSNKNNTNNREYESCEMTEVRNTITKMYTKLISSDLKHYKILYEYLEQIDENNGDCAYFTKYVLRNKPSIKKHSVIICENENVINDFLPMHYKIAIISNCDSVGEFDVHDVLFVLAPKPFHGEQITHLPVIFYNTPYLLPEHKAIYPNSTCLYKKYFKTMTHGLLQFIKLQGWSRIAIISDDLPYSDDFQAQIIKLFNENSVVYSLHQCLDSTCDLAKALEYLKEKEAKIIIANVDEKYAKKLVNAAADINLTANDNVLWIFRDWPFQLDVTPNVVKELREVISITVSQRNEEKSFTNKINILEGIRYIEDTIYMEDPEMQNTILETSLSARSSLLMSMMKNVQLEKPSTVYVWQLTSPSNIDTVFTFDVKTQKVTQHKKLIYLDVQPSCSVRSYKFDSPCEESYPLIILLVILILLLAVLIIVLYIWRCSPRRRNYRSLKTD